MLIHSGATLKRTKQVPPQAQSTFFKSGFRGWTEMMIEREGMGASQLELSMRSLVIQYLCVNSDFHLHSEKNDQINQWNTNKKRGNVK